MRPYHDLPREELMRKASEMLMSYPPEVQAQVYFKFTCEKCGERVELVEANTLYEKGECCLCGHETEIKRGGFSLHLQARQI